MLTRKKFAITATLALSLLPISKLLADDIVLNNGDKLTGTITEINPTSVKVSSPLLGDLVVPAKNVRSLRSDNKVTIIDAAGQSHTAFVAPAPLPAPTTEGAPTIPPNTRWTENVAAVPPASATVVVPPVAVAPPIPAATTTPPAPLDLEKYYMPIGTHWKNQLAIGASNATGNTTSTTFTGEVDFNYKNDPSEFNSKIGGAYGVTNGTSSAQLAFGDAIYRRDLPGFLDSKWFYFAESHNLYDGLKGISFRTIDNTGLGYYLFKTPKFNMDLRAGPGVTYIKHFEGNNDTDLTGLVGLRAVYTFNDRASLSEEALYTVGLTDDTRYQITSDTALNLKLPEIQRGLGLKLAFLDDYDSTATEGDHKPNDTLLTLSLTLDF